MDRKIIKGTNIAAPIVPFTDKDQYATHEAKYGKGGWRTVENLDELRSIPKARLEEGMVVHVIEDPDGIHTYQYFGGVWLRATFGQGIPVLTEADADRAGLTNHKYIGIPDIDTDLNGAVTKNTYTTTQNGTYVDVLFKAIRQLQTEVSKLRNSFKMGIVSYNDIHTSKSTDPLLEDNQIPEEEPLWATDEDGLSDLGVDIMKSDHGLLGDSVTVYQSNSESRQNILKVTGTSTWLAPEEVVNCEDSKVYLFFTTNRPYFKLFFGREGETVNAVEGLDGRGNLINGEDLLGIGESLAGERYNVMVVLSNSKIYQDADYETGQTSSVNVGKDFIWVSVSDKNNRTIKEGYLDGDGLSEEFVSFPFSPKLLAFQFSESSLYKFKVYSKYQEISKSVQATRPEDDEFKYKVAHLTIRSVSSHSVLLAVQDQLLPNELVWEESEGNLWIKGKAGRVLRIGGGSSLDGVGNNNNNSNDSMTEAELLDRLKELGIVKVENGGLVMKDLNVDDISFVHTESGNKFKYTIDSEGNLKSTRVTPTRELFSEKIKNVELTSKAVRGFIGQLNSVTVGKVDQDLGLKADRLKIGAFYAPHSTDKFHGCTHCFIELENTSDVDIPLTGFYLHLTRPHNTTAQQITRSLALTGTIKAGSTYLVRGRQYEDASNPNTFINVDSYDQEWWDGNKLIDLEISDNLKLSRVDAGYGIALTWGNAFGEERRPLAHNTQIYNEFKNSPIQVPNGDSSKFPYVLDKGFIDAIYYDTAVKSSAGSNYWAKATVAIGPNQMYRNTFELDPAKQAYQSLTLYDSSRVRWQSANDIQVVDLNNRYIEFPNSDQVYDIANYAPKASWQNKNVITGKADIDPEKPSMPTVSFGIDIYKTRTFNWISAGHFDEAVWIRRKGTQDWGKAKYSYTPYLRVKVSSIVPGSGAINSTAVITPFTQSDVKPEEVLLQQYTLLTDKNSQKITDKVTITSRAAGSSVEYVISFPNSITSLTEDTEYLIKRELDGSVEGTFPKKKYFNGELTNAAYSRITSKFPGNKTPYTSHKVILDVVETSVNSPTTYEYVVGRADKNGNPDVNHTSKVQSFTLYPERFKPRVYQITDNQSFTWIEYQVWSACAKKIDEKIKEDQRREEIIPILVNTGDMVQNGTRINEWIDYFEGGYCLFDHLEQINIVGNNDLADTDPTKLGTGDDFGKSNPYFFHLFYCHEASELFNPIIPNLKDPTKHPKYVPSLYYIDSVSTRFLMTNSEITEATCQRWFESVREGNKTVNVYNGYTIDTREYVGDFTSIYTMIYKALEDARSKRLGVLVAAHEMPFTVITNSSLTQASRTTPRSVSGTSLVGSHMNQITTREVGVGTYWFSRLLEHFGVKLVIGGHKHTYACTYPVRENYLHSRGTLSSETGPMTMTETLGNDDITFTGTVRKQNSDLTKFPFVKATNDLGSESDSFFPAVPKSELTGGVIYFMCQATGYKLTSNKELPSSNQKFSMLIPQTTVKDGKDVANSNQKYPMFSIIDVPVLKENKDRFTLKLVRVHNVFTDTFKFNQREFAKAEPFLSYCKPSTANPYGIWDKTEGALLST